MSRLSPKQSETPITKTRRVSGFELRMICRPDIIMKQTTKTMMAPTTGAGMIDSSALSLGEKPSRMNSAPAAIPIHRLVAPEAALRDTLLDDVSDATPPSRPDTVTAMPSAIRPLPMRLVSGAVHSSSLTFSHMTRLPNDFNAPQIDTIANTGSSDQRNSRSNAPLSHGKPSHGADTTR